MKTNPEIKLRSNQEGLVSIVVAVILILLMSLIVLAMAENSRREQRQTLDRQLSDQAFYNAETGINDVDYYLFKKQDAAIEKLNCLPLSDPPAPLGDSSKHIDGTEGANKYTCAQYNKAPPTLEYEDINTGEPKVFP